MHLFEELEYGTCNTGIRTLSIHSQYKRLHLSYLCSAMVKALGTANN